MRGFVLNKAGFSKNMFMYILLVTKDFICQEMKKKLTEGREVNQANACLIRLHWTRIIKREVCLKKQRCQELYPFTKACGYFPCHLLLISVSEESALYNVAQCQGK